MIAASTPTTTTQPIDSDPCAASTEQAISAVSPGTGRPNDSRASKTNIDSSANWLCCSMKVWIEASGGLTSPSSLVAFVVRGWAMVTVGDAGEQEPAAPATAHPLQRILFIVAFTIAAGGLASLLGWDIRGWFEQVWDTLRTIAVGYIVAGVVALTVQTAATAYAWYAILRYGYPGELRWRQMLAAYAACVALNNVLPANLGTIVMFVMLTTLMPSATFAGLLGGFAVEKIFFTVAGIFVYLYLFLSVGGSFGISFSFITENPAATVALLIGGAVVL